VKRTATQPNDLYRTTCCLRRFDTLRAPVGDLRTARAVGIVRLRGCFAQDDRLERDYSRAGLGTAIDGGGESDVASKVSTRVLVGY